MASTLYRQIAARLKSTARACVRLLWVLNSRVGLTVSLPLDLKGMVILTGYQAERMKNIEPLIRSALKCTFVEKVIVSNHNPLLHIRDWVKITDRRLTLTDQVVRRGAGYQWELMKQEAAHFVLAIDNDTLLFPRQMARLFAHVAAKPEVPHGIAGETNLGYIQSQEAEVNTLFQAYAVTGRHIQSYSDRLQAIRQIDQAAADGVEIFGDDLIISATGAGLPMIHNIGFVLRCATASERGVSTFTMTGFEANRVRIQQCLEATRAEGQVSP
jgi:hypothetical protein